MFVNLKNEIITFIICIIISATALILTSNHWNDIYFKKNDAIVDLNNAKEIYYTALNKKELLQLFEKKYSHLQKIGVMGDENRLNWVDTLDKISKKYKIPYLKYKIDKQQSLISDSLAQRYPNVDLLRSTMTLQLQLLHEGDLYTIINNLRKQSKGLFDVSKCAIIRNETQVDSLLDSPTDKNFSASCTLNWYTIKTKNNESPTDILSQGSS